MKNPEISAGKAESAKPALSPDVAGIIVAALLLLSIGLALALWFLVTKIQETSTTIKTEKLKLVQEEPQPVKSTLIAPAPSSQERAVMHQGSTRLYDDALKECQAHSYSKAAVMIGNSIVQYRIELGKDTLDDLDKQTLATRYRLIAHCHYKLSNMRLAVFDLTNAIKLAPGTSDDYSNRAIAYQSLGYFQQAHEDVETASLLESQQKVKRQIVKSDE